MKASPKTLARMEARANVVKALAHPTRLLVIEELAARERSVGELQKLVDCDLSTMSKHLSILRTAGILKAEKRGTLVYYSLSLNCAPKFFECIDNMLAHDAQRRSKVCS